MKHIPIVVMLMFVTAHAWAQGGDGFPIYIGGGFGSAEVPQVEESQPVQQAFLGYRLTPAPRWGGARYGLAVEAGYTDVDSYPYDRYWGTGLANVYLSGDVDLLLRLGVEAGNNRGFFSPLVGVGAEYKSGGPFDVRLELFERDDSPMALLGVVYRP